MKKAPSTAPQFSLTNEAERKRVEEAVKTNEALLRLFIKHTPAAIAMFDTGMRYLQVSDRFLTDYDLEGQDLIGKSHYDMFPHLPERWKEAHRRTNNTLTAAPKQKLLAVNFFIRFLLW